MSVSTHALCFAIFACAFNLLLGYTGLLSFGHAAYLGAAAYGTGWLTGLDVGTETFVQTSQRGEVRRLSFDEVRLLTPQT